MTRLTERETDQHLFGLMAADMLDEQLDPQKIRIAGDHAARWLVRLELGEYLQVLLDDIETSLIALDGFDYGDGEFWDLLCFETAEWLRRQCVNTQERAEVETPMIDKNFVEAFLSQLAHYGREAQIVNDLANIAEIPPATVKLVLARYELVRTIAENSGV